MAMTMKNNVGVCYGISGVGFISEMEALAQNIIKGGISYMWCACPYVGSLLTASTVL